MKFLAICFGLFFPYVLSRSIFESNLQPSLFEELQDLQELTNELDAQGTYTLSNSKLLEVDVNDFSVFVYTQSDPSGTEVSFLDADAITNISSFNLQYKTIVYIYGWLEIAGSNYSVSVKNAILNSKSLNVLIVNWDECSSSINYVTSWGCVKGIGNYLGQFLSTIRDTYDYSLDYVTLAGHSLGAHIAGFAGKYTGGTTAAIVGLDPAGPLFFESSRDNRLNEDDAQYVQAIHTAAFFLGVNYNVGDVDFWPNGGQAQPGCGVDLFGKCSHLRAILYYIESVKDNNFVGRQCESYNNFEDGLCNDNLQGYMGGIDLETSLTDEFYLNTNDASPYGIGSIL